MLVLAVAKAHNVKKIVMFDIEQSRAQFAQKYGADVGIVAPMKTDPSIDSSTFAQNYAKNIITQQDVGQGFDVVVEASGAEICAQMGVFMLKSGGTMVQAGLGNPLPQVPLFQVTARELTIKG